MNEDQNVKKERMQTKEQWILGENSSSSLRGLITPAFGSTSTTGCIPTRILIPLDPLDLDWFGLLLRLSSGSSSKSFDKGDVLIVVSGSLGALSSCTD